MTEDNNVRPVQTSSPLQIGDAAETAERYRVEREKRLRPEGARQYQRLEGDLAHYLDDPSAAPPSPRPARTDVVDVVIIGGGFGGLLTAARMLEAGVENFLIIDKASDFGGTWYWNRYPGAACDIESYIYLPLLEEVGYLPSEKYARQPEIFDYIGRISRHYDLYSKAMLSTEVVRLTWDDSAQVWTVDTDHTDVVRARFVCMANGNPLHRPKLPGVDGIDSFAGKAFHTSRWDYGYTGGLSDGRLTGLADKRVGLIGTGATAVQVVPQLGKWAEQLYVFQRTPSSIDVRNNRATERDWIDSLTPGWQRRRMLNFTTLLSGGREDEDLVADGWTETFWQNLQAYPDDDLNALASLLERSDFEKMEEIRARVASIVKDPATADALKPWYRRLCKRPCFHDDYLDAFNNPNVTLVDTKGLGVDRITARGVVVEGRTYELDCLIFATGFEFGTDFAKRIGFDVVGQGGQSLASKWASGASTLHGMHTRGFPNCLIISMVQAGTTPNVPHMLDEQASHAAYVVKTCLERGVHTVQPTEQAEQAWVAEIVRLAGPRADQIKDCTPGYLNNEGAPTEMNYKNSHYAGGALKFIEILTEWRRQNQLEGLELT